MRRHIFLAAIVLALALLLLLLIPSARDSITPLPGLTLITTPPTAVADFDRHCGANHGCVFGHDWTDDHDGPWGHDGCDQLNQLRARDLTNPIFKNPRSCKVTGGTLHEDPYTGQRDIPLTNTSGDHVFPLRAAWDRGAHSWTLELRITFANDPDNLILTTRHGNSSKSDHTPDAFTPATATGRCRYARSFITVAARYHLPVTWLENWHLHRNLRSCQD